MRVQEAPQTSVGRHTYADDYVGAGNLHDLIKWWDKLTKRGPNYRYDPNKVNFLLAVTNAKENLARKLFSSRSIKITVTEACHLEATVGSEEFKEGYVKMKVKEMTEELEKLSEIGEIDSHIAYATFTLGWKHKRTYLPND